MHVKCESNMLHNLKRLNFLLNFAAASILYHSCLNLPYCLSQLVELQLNVTAIELELSRYLICRDPAYGCAVSCCKRAAMQTPRVASTARKGSIFFLKRRVRRRFWRGERLEPPQSGILPQMRPTLTPHTYAPRTCAPGAFLGLAPVPLMRTSLAQSAFLHAQVCDLPVVLLDFRVRCPSPGPARGHHHR